jgi:hypothetical protein
LKIDHVLLAVPELDTAARVLMFGHGLDSYEGGRHPGWGTANRIVPLGESYLELITVVDEVQADASSFGRWIAEASRHKGNALGWCVRPADLSATASRLGLAVEHGARQRPDGTTVEWCIAGLEEAARRPYLPFFIGWRDPATFPGRTERPAASLRSIEVECEPSELETWLGPHALPLKQRPGDGRVAAVVFAGARGPVRLDAFGL